MNRATVFLISVAGLVLLSGIALSQTRGAKQSRSEKLDEHEYATVGLIYNQELGALGDEAIYPVCVATPAGTNNSRLLHYLRRAGYPISNQHVCYPPNGRFNPNRDYPHGMSIIIGDVHHNPNRTLDITVAIGDNTMHFERDLATTLRNGIYHFRSSESGEWELTGYTKSYDYRVKKQAGCK